MNLKNFLLPCLFSLSFFATAQVDSISFNSLNNTRINTDKIGMIVLGSWGAANVLAGTAGAFAATDQEAKSFYTMNAIWGVINFSIAGLSYAGTKRDLKEKRDVSNMLHRYESDKRLYLINGGLDIFYIGSGLLLNAYSHEFKNPARWRGYGKSIVLQGAALLIFDATMFSMHQRQDKKWYKLLQGICVTQDGVGLRYKL